MERNPQRKKDQAGRELWLIRGGALLLALVLAGLTWAAGRAPSKPAGTVPIEMRVLGMDCHVWCPVQIDDALGNVPGVYDLFVDVDGGRVTAEIEPQKVTRDRLVGILRGRGWDVFEPGDQVLFIDSLEP
ncbi:MAG: hypothetical protein P1V35_03570 [Planctomycetota bacterium]|nr:hypothetical protein [Planctomycetota bacterium]